MSFCHASCSPSSPSFPSWGLLRRLVQTLCIEFMSTLCPDIQEQHSLGYVPHPPRPKLDVIAADHVQSWSCAAKLKLSAPTLVDQINLPVPTASKSRVRRQQTSAVEREKSERDKVFLFWMVSKGSLSRWKSACDDRDG